MSIDSSAKFSKITKKDYKESLVKNTEFSPKKKKKSNNMGVKNIKIYLKMKNKGWLIMEKII